MEIKEFKLRLCGIAFMMMFVSIFIFGVLIHDIRSASSIIFVSFVFASIYWESSRSIVFHACKKLPGLNNTKRRIKLILQYLIPCILFLPVIEMVILQFTNTIYFSKHNYWNYLFYFGLNLICIAGVVILYESIYYIRNWKISLTETEEMKKINLNAQYQILKEQIKPHFLFNSLNTLASLISSNPGKAEEFVEEMSTVYRYLLSKKEIDLASLEDEINFLNSYILMLKTRFGESLEISIDIGEDAEKFLLPPFVLQLLVENAVKHNIVSRNQKLSVDIKRENEHLIVVNNIQKKPVSDPSEKTGLMNLITRYKLLNKEDQLLILNDDVHFRVVLPLIIKPN